jgi:hypothetical protein
LENVEKGKGKKRVKAEDGFNVEGGSGSVKVEGQKRVKVVRGPLINLSTVDSD